MSGTCETCKFSEPSQVDEMVHCVFYAPSGDSSLLKLGSMGLKAWVWPLVPRDARCGEYVQRSII